MKSGILNALFFLAAATASAGHKKVSALFIGNSYVYVNNLPLLIESIAGAGGDTLVWDVNAIGGYTLRMHSTDSVTLAKIHLQQWDYVVLQEQSQLPSFEPGYVDTATIPFALFLDSVIHAGNPCARTVFFETWGRKYGDASNCAFYPPVCTYAGMQDRLRESYKLMADTCHAIMAPVGEAFRNSIANDSTANLYIADNSHPSINGSYLAASVFYQLFFHKDVTGNSYNPGVTQLPLATYQQLARQTVADSLQTWNLGVYEPWAEFSRTELPGCNAAFLNSSSAAFTHTWDFGDTTASTDPNPVHHYLYPGNFQVVHVVSESCSSDTFLLTHTMVCSGSSVSENSELELHVFPNPAKNAVIISNSISGIRTVRVNDIEGKCVVESDFSGREHSVQLDVSGLTTGMYFFLCGDETGRTSAGKFAILR